MDLSSFVSGVTSGALTQAGTWLGQLGPMIGILFALSVLGVAVGVVLRFLPRG